MIYNQTILFKSMEDDMIEIPEGREYHDHHRIC